MTEPSGHLAPLDTPIPLSADAAQHARQVDRSVEPIFELRKVCHSYGPNRVIFDVDLAVWPGEVVALIGDNGAGKSTLLKIFAGYQRPTAGMLRFAGRDVRFGSPADARALGIEAVYQDLAIIDQLSLWRNFFLGKELVRAIGPLRIMQRSQMREACESALAELGLTRIRSAEDPPGHCQAASVNPSRSPAPGTSVRGCCSSMSRPRHCRSERRGMCSRRSARLGMPVWGSCTSITT
ncbi:MAG: ATP-binding cassette domain-containing protein [Chloroflexota bacterium]